MHNIIDIKLQEKKQPEQEQNDRIEQLIVTPDGEFAITAFENSTLKVWRVATGELLHTLDTEPGTFYGMGLTPDGKHVAVVNFGDKILKIWHIASGKKQETINNGYRLHVKKGPLISDGQIIVPPSNDHTIRQWYLKNGKKVMTLQQNVVVWFTIVEVNFDITKSIYPLSEYQLINKMDILNPYGGKDYEGITQYSIVRNSRFQNDDLKERGFDAFSSISDNLYVFTTKENGDENVWDLANGVKVCTIPKSESGADCGYESIAIHPNCQYIVKGCENGFISIFDKTNGKEELSFAAHFKSVTAVAFIPDLQSFVSVSSDRTLKVWDLKSGKLLSAYFGKSKFTVCAVACDGTIIATESSGKIYFLKIEHTNAS